MTVLFSGGVDSATLLYFMRSTGHKVTALSVDYGQRHRKEIEAAKAICVLVGIPHTIADISAISQLLSCSSLTGNGGLSGTATIVPNRNMLFLSIAAAHAVSTGDHAVAYAPHAGDAKIYPDCRPAFCMAMTQVLLLGCGIRLETPFLHLPKSEIVAIGRRLNVPFDLTWSCYAGGDAPCGLCGACIERQKAFLVGESVLKESHVNQ